MNWTETEVLRENYATYQFGVGIAYLTLFVLGCIGNTMTLISICLDKQLHTIPNVYVANLALMDLFICTSMTVSPAYYVFTGEPFPYCRLFGFIAVYAIACSRLHLCCIALNRYALIVKGVTFYTKAYTVRNVQISAVGSYLIPLVILMAALAELYSKFTYNYKTMNCFFEADTRETYWYITGIMEMMFFMPALFLTIIIYVLIIRKFQHVRRKVGDKDLSIIASTSTTTERTKRYSLPRVSIVPINQLTRSLRDQTVLSKLYMRKEVKCVLNLVAVFLVFLLCWSPLCFLLIIDYYSTVSPIVYSLFMLLGVSNSSLNVFIYAVMNQQFRKAYKYLLRCRCCRKSQ